MSTNSRRRDEENDCLVVVDGDESSIYGPSQYTESDIQSAMAVSKTPSSSQRAESETHADGRKYVYIVYETKLDSYC